MFITWQKQEQFNSFNVTGLYQGPVHTNPFSNENGAALLRFQKDLY